jgi:hypothetical protein
MRVKQLHQRVRRVRRVTPAPLLRKKKTMKTKTKNQETKKKTKKMKVCLLCFSFLTSLPLSVSDSLLDSSAASEENHDINFLDDEDRQSEYAVLTLMKGYIRNYENCAQKETFLEIQSSSNLENCLQVCLSVSLFP